VGKTWNLIAQTSGAKIYWLLMSLVTTAVTARYLGPSGRGVYVAAVTWVNAFSTIGYLSLSQVVIFIATGKQKDEWLPKVFGTLLAILGTIAVLGWLTVAGMYLFSGGHIFHNLSPVVLFVSFIGLPAALWIENGNGTLMALNKLHVLNIGQMAGATAVVILTLVFVAWFKAGVIGALGAMVISQFLILAITMGYIGKEAKSTRVDRWAARELLTGGAKLHLNAIGTYLFSQANVLILNNYRTPKETAYYHLSVQLVTALQVIPTAVSMVAYSLVAQEGPDAAWPKHRKLLGEAVLLIVGLAAIAYFAAPFGVSLVFGKAFLPSVPLFRILLLSVIGMTMSTVMACQWIARGLFVHAAGLTLFVGGATVLANFLTVPKYGMVGAAWVTVGTYSVSVVGNGIMALWVQSRYRRSLRVAYA